MKRIATAFALVFLVATTVRSTEPKPTDSRVEETLYMSGDCDTGWWVSVVSNANNSVTVVCEVKEADSE